MTRTCVKPEENKVSGVGGNVIGKGNMFVEGVRVLV